MQVFDRLFHQNRAETFLKTIATADLIINKYKFDKIVLTGDFNLPNVNWFNDEFGVYLVRNINTQTECILNYFAYLNFYQLNHIPNYSNNVLDLVFSDDSSILVTPEMPLVKDDKFHPPFNFNVVIKSDFRPLEFDHEYFNFKAASFQEINQYLGNINWNEVLNNDNVNILVDRFYHIIGDAIELYVPRCRARARKFPVWMNQELKSAIIKKKIAHKKYKTSGLMFDYLAFTEIRRVQDPFSVVSSGLHCKPRKFNGK